MPDIKKMKEKRKYSGLIKALKNKDIKVRVEAIKALSELKFTKGLIEGLRNEFSEVSSIARAALISLMSEGDINDIFNDINDIFNQSTAKTTESLLVLDHDKTNELLNKYYTDMIKFGSRTDRIEAITIMQGRLPTKLIFFFELRIDEEKQISNLKYKVLHRKFNLTLARPILLNIIENSLEQHHIRWYALIALIEIGERSDQIANLLINQLNTYPKMNYSIIRESIRALSYFNNPKIISMLIEVQKGQLYKGMLDVVPRSAAIYALSATNHPSAREFLEYLATRSSDEYYSKKAQIALKMFGKSYDEIKSKIESK